jgi:hypothetical protein
LKVRHKGLCNICASHTLSVVQAYVVDAETYVKAGLEIAILVQSKLFGRFACQISVGFSMTEF